MSTDQSLKEGNKLRHMFIAMLFAFVVSVLATKAADLLSVITSGWSKGFSPTQMFGSLLYSNGLLFVPFFHLVLAFMLVSMSWVMWSKSQSGGHQKPITSFFSIAFLILLVEMLLVVLYFALTNTVEQDVNEFVKTNKIDSFVKSPSAQPEAQVLTFVFLIWFFWDLISDVLTSARIEKPKGLWRELIAIIQGGLTYGLASLLCMFAAIWVSYVASSSTPLKIIFADLALICVMCWFRPAKRLEYYMIKIFPLERTRANTVYSDSITFTDIMKLVIPVLLFLIFLSLSSEHCLWICP